MDGILVFELFGKESLDTGAWVESSSEFVLEIYVIVMLLLVFGRSRLSLTIPQCVAHLTKAVSAQDSRPLSSITCCCHLELYVSIFGQRDATQ
jgi:hypothetical protein